MEESKIMSYRSHVNYKNLTIILLLLTGLLYLFGAVLVPTSQQGESNDFMMAAISIKNRFSLFVTEDDIKQAIVDYPEYAEYLKDSYYELSSNSNSIGPNLPNRLRLFGLPTNADEAKMVNPALYDVALNMRHSYYFSFYSFLSIPVKYILKKINTSRLSQSYAFAITNALIYMIALFIVFLKLKQSDKKKFWIILLLAINPAIFYIAWPSYEVCIFGFTIISLTFFANREYKKSALSLSLVGMMQPTIMVYGLVIIATFFVEIWVRENCNSIKSFLHAMYLNWMNIVTLALCFIPSIIPFIYFKIYFNVWGLNLNEASSDLVFARAFSYIFDLNLGILPYFGMILMLSIFMMIFGIVKRNAYSLAFFTMIFGTILGFSLIQNINSGMAGIARYNVFILPFLVFYVVIFYDKIFINKYIIRIFDIGIGLSVLLSGLVVFNYGTFQCKVSDQSMTPIAQAVLDHYPQYYNPFYATFISRTNHIAWGYDYESPVVYTTRQGYVRKALVTKNTANQLLTMLNGDESQMRLLKAKINDLEDYTEYRYINFDNNCTLIIKDKYGIIMEENYDIGVSSQIAQISAGKGQVITISLNLKNNTLNTFSSAVDCYLCYHILDNNGNVFERNGVRSKLKSLYPGQEQSQDMIVKTPNMVGKYKLVIDPVREKYFWFSERNYKPLTIDFNVIEK